MAYLITFQHPSVLETDPYYCTFMGSFHKRTPKAYGRLAERIGGHNPIFAWHTAVPGVPLSLEQIDRMLEMTTMGMNHLTLELQVPDELILLTNFYSFVDVRCEEEGLDNYDWSSDGRYGSYEDYMEACWEAVFNIREDSEIQAIIPYIKREWIIQVHQNLIGAQAPIW